MRPSPASSSPLRRLLAALLALGVLLATLGGAHAPCDAPAAPHAVHSHGAARGGVGHGDVADVGGAGGDLDHRTHGGPVDRAPADGPAHDRHDAPAAGVWALVAHCAALVVAVAATPSPTEVEVAASRTAPRDTRALEPSLEPDSPPPKG